MIAMVLLEEIDQKMLADWKVKLDLISQEI
jgi:hypothetical protein